MSVQSPQQFREVYEALEKFATAVGAQDSIRQLGESVLHLENDDRTLEALAKGIARRQTDLIDQFKALFVRLVPDITKLSAEQAAGLDRLANRLEALARNAPPTPAEQFYKGLNAVGILNYQNDRVTGERRFLSRFAKLKADPVVLDVGANVGDYSRLVRELSPAARIIAFEPHPISFGKLSETCREIRAEAHPIGLGDRPAQLDIFDYAENDGSQHASLYRTVIEQIHSKPATRTLVAIETLDEVVGKIGIDQIELLKVDTEGHELAVFKGAERLLAAQRIAVIQFEFNEMNAVSRSFFHDFREILSNYRLFRLLEDRVLSLENYRPPFMEVFAFQNIVGVRRDIDPSWLIK
jgi:FkbM family methyltransferase